jgi:hypothetical protein
MGHGHAAAFHSLRPYLHSSFQQPEGLRTIRGPFTKLDAAYGMAMYSVKAVLHGQGGDVLEMIRENL